MAKRVLVLDTSILCCWLRVPNKETAGSDENLWNHSRVEQLLAEETASKRATLVLPIAALIEAGNHIANAPSNRYECAQRLAQHLLQAIDAATPWAAFTEQSDFWQAESVKALAERFPDLAAKRISLADATIQSVAEYYARAGYEVSLLTGDRGLHEYYSQNLRRPPRRAVKVVT